MNIAIVTCTTPNREWLYNLTNPSKISYSVKYGYDYIFDTDKYYDRSMKPGWNKIRFIYENLLKYDYVVWLDDDAGFIREDRDVIGDAIKEMDGRSIFICKDMNGLNSGMMIFKSCEFSKKFLNDIWDHRELYRNNNHGHPGVMEQPAIIDLCNIFTDDICIGDGRIYNAYDSVYTISKPNQRNSDSFILHIAAGSSWKEAHKDLIRRLFIK